jgi:hypothetical protein
MSKLSMRGNFRHLHFNTFPMTPRTPQCEVFWPFNLSTEFSGVPEDSKFPLLGVWVSPSHLAQSGVATDAPIGFLINQNGLKMKRYGFKTYFFKKIETIIIHPHLVFFVLLLYFLCSKNICIPPICMSNFFLNHLKHIFN